MAARKWKKEVPLSGRRPFKLQLDKSIVVFHGSQYRPVSASIGIAAQQNMKCLPGGIIPEMPRVPDANKIAFEPAHRRRLATVFQNGRPIRFGREERDPEQIPYGRSLEFGKRKSPRERP